VVLHSVSGLRVVCEFMYWLPLPVLCGFRGHKDGCLVWLGLTVELIEHLVVITRDTHTTAKLLDCS
jgi:hypothetical protein